MFSELDRVLDEIRKDKGIDKEVLINALETALVKAALNKYGHNLDIEAHYNAELGEIELFQFKAVAEEPNNIIKEISLEEARKIDPDLEALHPSRGEKQYHNKIHPADKPGPHPIHPCISYCHHHL